MSPKDTPARLERTDDRTRLERGMASMNRGRFSRRTVLKTIGGGTIAGGLFATSVTARSDTLAKQLNTVRAATRKYRDVATATADGYIDRVFVPHVGHILADPALVPDDTVDITEPEALIYIANQSTGEDEDSDLTLAAAEYIVPGDQAANPPNLFADEPASRHLTVTEEEGWHYNTRFEVTGLHVWVHRGNPAGVFSLTNPSI